MPDQVKLPTTPAFLGERETLDPSLRPEFDALVLDYRYFAALHYQHPYVSYKVLADLVKTGWRSPVKK
jgi:hypothetical protein